jgi:hypothetical protein
MLTAQKENSPLETETCRNATTQSRQVVTSIEGLRDVSKVLL